ncbi:MAG: bifunctional folylpolyglutamate synthase/dihydrofolate synthase [Prevotella sp.]|nr:bifunctional folylpolyglutamate synthase/dihydrofolate synthase [Prevotella sp.]
MNYKETVEYLFNSTPVFEHVGASAYKEGLSNTLALDEHLGHPHKNFKAIHVAGTNGKGSCSHTLAAILQSMGMKVGLYTSPHIVDFRERIRVNGECLSEQYVVDFVEQHRSFFEPLHPSFFELTTAMAFRYFADQKVDIAVIEVGLGGRLDCTNIITPELSIITNISLDHTQFLGDTLAKIAGEKAGIIKEGVKVVIGEDVEETRPVFEAKAKEKNAPIVFAQDYPEVLCSEACAEGGRNYETLNFGMIHGDLSGDYQERNMNTCLTACKVLGLKKENVIEAVAHVAERTGLVGRWMKINESPLAVCDTGHNVGGWKYLAPQIKAQKCEHLRIVFGMVDDKDIDSVMDMLPKNAIYYWTQATSHRAIPKEIVADKGRTHQLEGNIYNSVKEAYREALKDASNDDFVFVGGSSYVVADLLS